MFTYGGHYIIDENVLSVHWISYLPLLIVLTEGGLLRVLGPDISLIPEDINSFISMLSYSMNTHARYHWKCYSTIELKGIKEIMHIHTFRYPDTYDEQIILFSDKGISIAFIEIKDTNEKDNIEVNIDIKETNFIDIPIKAKYLLQPPELKGDPCKICIQTNKDITVYLVSPERMEKTAVISLTEEPELIRVNNYQTPIIAIMNKSKIVKMYMDNGNYLGFIDVMEIHGSLKERLDLNIKKIDMLFYQDPNIQALVLLLNQRMVLLCNNYRYESMLRFVFVDVFDKPVPYCLDSPIMSFEQSSSDSIILCTKQKAYLIQKLAIKDLRQGRKVYISLKRRLHKVNEMQPIYHPSLLREYLIFGDMKKLKMILLHLYDKLKDTSIKDTIPIFLDIPPANILGELAERKKSLREMLPKSDDLFDAFITEKIKPTLNRINSETEFKQLITIKDELIELIQSTNSLRLSNSEREELVSLIRNLKVFLAYQKTEDEISQEFLLHMNVANVHWNLGKHIPIATMDVALAYHCQNQDFLLKILLDPIGNYGWEDIRRFGIPLWIKETAKLKTLIEQVAIEEYKRSKAKDIDKVNDISIWYILLNKKAILVNLYKNTEGATKIYEFLGHNFSEERWKKAALRNGYQLLSQKKYKLAATFYLLGNWINEAVQVAITHLQDLYLAITICRLMEEGKEEVIKIYKEYYIDKGIAYGDPWIVSLGNWLCGNYIEALNCIAYVLSREEPMITNELDPQLNLFCRRSNQRRRALTEEWPFESPSLSRFNASMIVLCRKLVKHHLVYCLVIVRLQDQQRN